MGDQQTPRSRRADVLRDTAMDAYKEMVGACYRKTHKRYPVVGGRGIGIIKSWRKSFDWFLHDMGLPPSTQAKLRRVNDDESFHEDNCVWYDN
jgi:hypothetical protein